MRRRDWVTTNLEAAAAFEAAVTPTWTDHPDLSECVETTVDHDPAVEAWVRAMAVEADRLINRRTA